MTTKARVKTPAGCPICGDGVLALAPEADRAAHVFDQMRASAHRSCAARQATREGLSAGLARRSQDEAAIIGRRFGMTLTPREMAIFRHGVNVGYDRGYRQRKAAA